MSTAIAEKTEAEVTLPPVGDAPTPAQKEAFLKFVRGGQSKSKDNVTTEKVVTEVVKSEPVKTEEKKVEEKKEAPKTEAKTDVKTEPVQSDAEKNFAALRQKAEAAEKAAKEAAEERDRFKTEMEELRKKPAPEEFVKELEETKKQKAEYQKRLREADLARDPEFNAPFDEGMKRGMQQMVDILAAAGVDRKEAAAILPTWNRAQIAEWMELLGPVEKMEFGAAAQEVMTLYNRKEAALAQSEQTYQTLQKQREEAAKSQKEKYESGLNADIEANLKELSETPLGKDHTDLLKETRTLLRRAGGLEGERIDNKTLLGMVGKSLLLAKGFERQEKTLEENAKKIAELEKTLAERDKFIKDQHDANPTVNGIVTVAKADRKAIARSILNPVIN